MPTEDTVVDDVDEVDDEDTACSRNMLFLGYAPTEYAIHTLELCDTPLPNTTVLPIQYCKHNSVNIQHQKKICFVYKTNLYFFFC